MFQFYANQVEFTIHFATINTTGTGTQERMELYLQYTLLLLIRLELILDYFNLNHLQYTLLLLIHFHFSQLLIYFQDLQYTLLLLIHWVTTLSQLKMMLFTIHFATINTVKVMNKIYKIKKFTIHFATINTLLHI